MLDCLELSKSLIRCKTVCPVQGKEGFLPLVEVLEGLGFSCQFMEFSESDQPSVMNLVATIGSGHPHIWFAGHMDVVPPGDISGWSYPPFEPKERDGMLIGRGASDMKCAIACFITAVSRYVSEWAPGTQGAISLVLTGDEEGTAVNGTHKMLHALKQQGDIGDACIVGEPTSVTHVADTIKIGRRGSITFNIKFLGIQGHVAYPHLANNPIPALAELMLLLHSHTLDTGSDFFDPSTLQVVNIHSGAGAANIIPGEATLTCNIRFNDQHCSSSLHEWLENCCAHIAKKHAVRHQLTSQLSAEPFGGKPNALSTLLTNVVTSITGKTPDLSTSGGTSDARFITHYMPVVELGLLNATAHKVDEQVAIADLYTLTDIYYAFLKAWFSNQPA